jgi:hypothetical protein
LFALSLPSLRLSSFSAFAFSLFALEGMIEVTLENDEDEGVIKRLLIQKVRSHGYQL